jgi:penicillin-binding protein 1A
MAKRTSQGRRIEPRFEAGPSGAAEMRVEADDRVVSASRPRSATKRRGSAPPGGNKRGKSAKGRSARRPWLRRSVYWGLVLAIWAAIGLSCLVAYYAMQLPSMASWKVPERPPNARIVSVDGELIANRGTTGGEAMRLDEMSPWLPLAVIAIEDRRFKVHSGVDPVGLGRAMITNLFSGRLVQGGSTLTQQLAKNLFLEPERTLERKVQEAVLAIWLETQFTKDQILELYLNRVYFGAGAYGVDAAARRYFAKSARDITLAEAAILAGLLKAPSRLAPTRDPQAAEERAQTVLAAMRREGFITEREATQAMAMEPGKAKRYRSGSENYVADMIMAQLPALIGEMRSDVIVSTTVDLGLQRKAGVLVGQALAAKGDRLNVSQGALVAIDTSGAIRALVGGGDYSASQFNRAVDAKRQPGSAFKPFVYLAAMEAGRTPETVRQDVPVKFGKWAPENYDREYRGTVTLNDALALSLNTVAAQLAMEVGPAAVVETAHRLGVKSELQPNASIALGTSEVSLLELAAAYAPFANGGTAISPYLIRRVTTSTGDILYERRSVAGPKVVRSGEIGMMNAMLRSVIRDGTGRSAAFDGRDVAGKTGTTDNSRDALFVGYTTNLVTAVWFGNDDGAPMKKVTGGGLPAETFSAFMSAAHEGLPPSVLPGNYVPENAIAGTTPELAQDGKPTPIQDHDDHSEFGSSAPRPAAGVGEGSETVPRRRNLFELLFGSPG